MMTASKHPEVFLVDSKKSRKREANKGRTGRGEDGPGPMKSSAGFSHFHISSTNQIVHSLETGSFRGHIYFANIIYSVTILMIIWGYPLGYGGFVWLCDRHPL